MAPRLDARVEIYTAFAVKVLQFDTNSNRQVTNHTKTLLTLTRESGNIGTGYALTCKTSKLVA